MTVVLIAIGLLVVVVAVLFAATLAVIWIWTQLRGAYVYRVRSRLVGWLDDRRERKLYGQRPDDQ